MPVSIPLGGYVKMLGEDREEELEPHEAAGSFSEQSVWKRLVIVFAGPFSNFVLAILMYTLLFDFQAYTNYLPKLARSMPALRRTGRPQGRRQSAVHKRHPDQDMEQLPSRSKTWP